MLSLFLCTLKELEIFSPYSFIYLWLIKDAAHVIDYIVLNGRIIS
jgi:hypothetical protein